MSRPPQRIQRKRTKGWRMPEGAIYVGRPTIWGNPWRVGSTGWTINPGGHINRDPHPPLTEQQAVDSYRNSVVWQLELDPDYLADLRGRDLACWCREGDPCHGDVLLELANGGAT